MFDADAYQRFAIHRSIGAPPDRTLFFALGMAGESGEVVDKIKKIMRSDYDLKSQSEGIILELGDVLWYLANYAHECRVKLSQIAAISEHVNRLEENHSYEKWPLTTSKLAILSLRLDKFVAVFSSNESLSPLSGQSSPSPVNGDGLVFWMGMIFHVIEQIGFELGADIALICAKNEAKLLDRDRRGTNRGDGDNR